ncbi:MAG: type II toxin-antitoxin system RelE/ParE family toxin [Phycisphaerales bacterium]|jgi:mRNA interferase RelE/StbE|nr:type II toxin-antitoxin system RelE/ParE family toxin [Phycisphaerales bacterium]
MKYSLMILPSVPKAMRKIPAATRRRIDQHIANLADNPRPHGCLKLAGYPNAYRIRVGNYRIIYTIDDAWREVEVGIVADRKEAY